MASSKKRRSVLGWVKRNKVVSLLTTLLLTLGGFQHLGPVVGGAAQNVADESIAAHCVKHGAGPDCDEESADE